MFVPPWNGTIPHASTQTLTTAVSALKTKIDADRERRAREAAPEVLVISGR